MLLALPVLVFKLAIGGFLLALIETAVAKMRIFRVPEFLATAFLLAVIGLLVTCCWGALSHERIRSPVHQPARRVLLMLAFAMISQRRILSLIHLFAMQGAALVLATSVVGYVTAPAAPVCLGRADAGAQGAADPLDAAPLIDRLNVRWDVETLINIPTTCWSASCW
jgi:hypothetical protein